MKLYSDLTGRRTAQVLADLVVLFWVSFWVYAGRGSTMRSWRCTGRLTGCATPAPRSARACPSAGDRSAMACRWSVTS